ncbi:uncharacterized protein BDZ83DRAFT_373854 [Colletotrichum acutatum]|uniref:Uncharacterized protein n=1 Tax=Glomerella acutata TaxID=27357 RepID=A0AAD8XNG4_GLOAC|nr:uncharacterized protein BDZ83DRAFT_373854 [Colletotrichum acutatum]KAK1730527.1 hypothetical protein BDZ83DRAFT_373854 [Colletotrichum acutatum]
MVDLACRVELATSCCLWVLLRTSGRSIAFATNGQYRSFNPPTTSLGLTRRPYDSTAKFPGLQTETFRSDESHRHAQLSAPTCPVHHPQDSLSSQQVVSIRLSSQSASLRATPTGIATDVTCPHVIWPGASASSRGFCPMAPEDAKSTLIPPGPNTCPVMLLSREAPDESAVFYGCLLSARNALHCVLSTERKQKLVQGGRAIQTERVSRVLESTQTGIQFAEPRVAV